jgi:hypothetical protein
MVVSHNVTLTCHLLKCTLVKGVDLIASTNPTIKLK